MSKTGRPRRIPPATYARLQRKERIEVTEIIPLTADAAQSYSRAKDELSTAEMVGDPDRVAAAKAALEQVKTDIADDLVELKFQALPSNEYKELVRQFPPNPDEQEDHQRVHGTPMEFDAEGFAPALISACCVEPKMTVDEVNDLVTVGGWSTSEFSRLFQLALMVNSSVRSISDPDF